MVRAITRVLVGIGSTEDIGHPRGLVEQLNRLVEQLTEGGEGVDDLLDGKPVDRTRQSTFFGEHGPVIHRDEVIFDPFLEHSAYGIPSSSVIDPNDLHCSGNDRDSGL